MRYPNLTDAPVVECYFCSDELPMVWAVRRGDAWACLPCSLDDAEYTGRGLTAREDTLRVALVRHLTRALDGKGE